VGMVGLFLSVEQAEKTATGQWPTVPATRTSETVSGWNDSLPNGPATYSYSLTVEFSYSVDARSYHNTQKWNTDGYEAGSCPWTMVYYNPKNPRESVVCPARAEIRGSRSLAMGAGFATFFASLGLLGVWVRAGERRDRRESTNGWTRDSDTKHK
jgi:hypothetical protein